MKTLFAIDTSSVEPIYRQLIEQVRRRVASGQWQAGAELPSTRELAHALSVNPNTVSKALSSLRALGVLERRRGMSMVVSANQDVAGSVADRTELLRPTLEQAAAAANQLGLTDERAMAMFKLVLQSRNCKVRGMDAAKAAHSRPASPSIQ